MAAGEVLGEKSKQSVTVATVSKCSITGWGTGGGASPSISSPKLDTYSLSHQVRCFLIKEVMLRLRGSEHDDG